MISFSCLSALTSSLDNVNFSNLSILLSFFFVKFPLFLLNFCLLDIFDYEIDIYIYGYLQLIKQKFFMFNGLFLYIFSRCVVWCIQVYLLYKLCFFILLFSFCSVPLTLKSTFSETHIATFICFFAWLLFFYFPF